MFKPLLQFIVSVAIIALASPAFAGSTSFQLTVTMPPHIMMQATNTPEQQKSVFQDNSQQKVQQQEITRNDRRIMVQSVVAL
jgi:hypothetical protein